MEKISSRKAKRKLGVQKSFKRQLIKDYDLYDKSDSRKPQAWPLWNVANGAWEKGRLRSSMIAAHIVPQMLGKTLLRKMFGGHHHFYDLYGSKNALLLPAILAYALDDWAITVVPNLPDDATEQERRAWVASSPKEYKFRVLDPWNEHLRKRFSSSPEDTRLGRDLHQQRLCFRETSSFRPSVKYLYFHHCCAIMSRYHHLFYDEPRQGYSEFNHVKKRKELTLKSESDRGSALYSTARFWQRMVEELNSININPNLILDWSMELKEPR